MHGRAAGWLSLVGRRCWLSCVGCQLLVVDCWLWINLFLIVACRLLVGGCWLSLVGFRSLVGDLLFVDSWLSIVAWRLLVVDCFGVDRWLSIVGCRWPAADYCLPIGRLSRWLAVRPLLSLIGCGRRSPSFGCRWLVVICGADREYMVTLQVRLRNSTCYEHLGEWLCLIGQAHGVCRTMTGVGTRQDSPVLFQGSHTAGPVMHPRCGSRMSNCRRRR